jgi:RNA polymerase sigma factor (TIGR02999 family)
MPDPTDMAALLNRARGGDAAANHRMVELVHEELQRLAGHIMSAERADHTLQPTALVHEACLKLFDQRGAWDGREHVLALAATVMRRVLADHARGRNRSKRGAGWERVTLSAAERAETGVAVDLVALDDTLARLAALAPRQARVVEMRFLAGMTVAEVAQALDLSRSTVEAEWRMARAWLRRELGGGAP